MQVKITKQNPDDDKHYDKFVSVSFNVVSIVMHRHYMIPVIDAGDGRMMFTMTHNRRLFVASIYNATPDQAIKATAPFFEAVKAGQQTFEVADA